MMALSRIKEATHLRRPAARRSPSSGTATGFDLMLQDRGGLGHEKLSRGARPAPRDGRQGPAPRRACGPTACRTCRSTRSTSTGRRPARSACRSARSRATSPTAFGSAYVDDFVQGGRVKRVYAQADAPVPHAAERPRPAPRPQQPGRARPALGRRLRALGLRLAAARALQRRPGDEHPGRAGAGAQLRRGDAGDGGARSPKLPAGHRLRVDRPLLPGAHVRVAGRAALRLLDPRHLPGPRGALRELDGADLDPARAAARRHRRRRWPPRCAACRTTSTSRSACSPCSA